MSCWYKSVTSSCRYAVLKEGNNYYGQATVAGQTYQTAYMLIKDNKGEAIGILYVGAPKTFRGFTF
ncbi:cache domain-containing protein [Metabacillus rhizosphaerae]|uniref:cache domain-containing protein n=1 Tax=Metabacillus rhizosphaerae TaxID=3117747 RepID=UPI0039B77F00